VRFGAAARDCIIGCLTLGLSHYFL
jgi:hypothetical protein